MENWFFITLLSIIAVAIAEIAQKISITSKKDFSSETINFLVAGVQLLLSIVFVFLFVREASFGLSVSEATLILVSGFLSFFFFKFLYGSYKGNSVSISQVIYSFSVFVSTSLGIILFQESITLAKILGIILVVLAVIIVSFKRGEKLSKYNLLALLSALVYGLLTTIDKSLSISINIHVYQILSVFSFMVFSLVLAPRKIVREIRQVDFPIIKTIIISAIGFTIFNKLTYLAYSVGGEIGKVDAVNNTSLFLIIVLEVLILKDRSNLKKKIIGSLLAVMGVMILGFL